MGDSLSLDIDLRENQISFGSRTYSEISVSDVIRILANVLKNVEELDVKTRKNIDSFDSVLYPVGVGMEKAVNDIKDILYNCGCIYTHSVYGIERVGVAREIEVNGIERRVEIVIFDGESDFLVYRREINLSYIKEMCEEIKSIIDKFKQSLPTRYDVVETVFTDV